MARPSVSAGFRCAPLNGPTANAAMATAMPQPHAMTIQPLFCALEKFSSVAATTPPPNRIRIAVPITSAPKMLTPPSDCRIEPEPDPMGPDDPASTAASRNSGGAPGARTIVRGTDHGGLQVALEAPRR